MSSLSPLSSPAPLVAPWPPPARARAIVPVFLTFRGCPARCIFCAQDIQTGGNPQAAGTHGDAPDSILAKARLALDLRAARGLPPAELAFYGGTFTALPPAEREACLDFAATALARGRISAFRCSTRPDCLDRSILSRLRQAGCTVVELGVQSFADTALKAARRGYDGAKALRACALVRASGLRLGVQLLPGMPGVSPEIFLADVARALEAGADMLRFYPCLVLAGTGLASLWQAGNYTPWDMESTLDSLARGWLLAQAAHTPVIRMGLAPEASLAGAILAGPVHPALGARVMGRALLATVRNLAARAPGGRSPQRLEAPRACQGYFWGHANELRPAWAALGLDPDHVRYTRDAVLRLWL